LDSSQDKSALLNQLKIDKTPQQPVSLSVPHVFLVACAALVLGAAVVYALMVGGTSGKIENHLDSRPTASANDVNRGESKPLADGADANIQNAEPAGTAILNASGYITARLVATVSAEVLGLITSVDVEEGMRVERGQILAHLDDAQVKVDLSLARAQVAVQQARLQSLQADLDEARRVQKRLIALQNEKLVSEAELTLADANVEKSESALATAKADIEVVKL